MFDNQYQLVKGVDKNSYDFDGLLSAIKEIFLENGKFNRLYCMNPENTLPDGVVGHDTLGNEHVYTDRTAIGKDFMEGTNTNTCFDVITDPITEKLRTVARQLVLDYSVKLTGEQKKDIEIDSAWVVIVDTGGYVATHTHVVNSGTIALSLHEEGKRTVTLVDDPAPFKQEHEFPTEKKFNLSCESGDFLIMNGSINHCVPTITNTGMHPLIVIDFRYV